MPDDVTILDIAPQFAEGGKQLVDIRQLYNVLEAIVDGTLPIASPGGGGGFGSPGNVAGQPAPAGTVGQVLTANFTLNAPTNGQNNNLGGALILPAGIWSVYGAFSGSTTPNPPQGGQVSLGGAIQISLLTTGAVTATAVVAPVMSNPDTIVFNQTVGPLNVNTATGVTVSAAVFPIVAGMTFTGGLFTCAATAIRTG